MERRNEYPLLHIYSQRGPRQPARIVGNTSGLLTLVSAIISATSIAGRGSGEMFCNDAETFEIQVERDDSNDASENLKLPYSK